VPVRRSSLLVVLLAAASAALAGACGSDDVSDTRADQVRQAATEAGLSADVADVLATAAQGATATFQVTYDGSDGAQVTVSQEPPNRRIDVIATGLIVESQLTRGTVSYRCEVPADGRPGDPVKCERASGQAPQRGAFTSEALQTFTTDLAGQLDSFDITTEARTIADAEATCLISAPKAGTPLDGTGPGVDTLCVSHEGAQLLVDVGGDRLVASAYSTTVPDGTFEL
jgi:hypothetical protein